MFKVDFHMHSTASDGLLTPTEVVKRAHKNGVKYMSLTDHDTVSGIDDAIKEGNKLGVKVIPGVELSTNFNGESIHVLGFFKDDSYKNEEFISSLNELKNKRVIRAEKIVDKLREVYDIDINFKNVLERGNDVVARPHIAKEIISAGYPYDIEYIFQNFIGKGCGAYIPTNKLTVLDGIKFLKKYNAITILAHPVLIKNSSLSDFLNIGLDGIEAVYFQNTKEDESNLISFAREHNLLITAGSDCHGDFDNDIRHGDIGDMPLDEMFLNKFLKKLNLL
ncbi:MAG: PHP domain-containing protein [Clostridium sp.]